MTITEPTYTADEATSVITNLQAVLEQANRRVDQYAHDLKLINTELQAEARNRNWCAEYEGFVERVNEQLDGDVRLTLRSSTSCFDITVKLRLTHSYGNRPTERSVAMELFEYLRQLTDDEDRDDTRDFEWTMPRVEFVGEGE